MSAGLACSISAIVPLTTGEAMLVPLIERYGSVAVGTVPHNRMSGLVLKSVLPAAVSDSMPTPGATMSGLVWKSSAVGPRELKPATLSSPRSTVPLWLDAPTVITHGALPGAPMAPYCGPAARSAAEIAGRGDDDQPRLDGAPGGEGQRVGLVRLVDTSGDREVDDPQTQGVLARNRVVDRGDDVADVTLARGVEDLCDEQRGAGRDAAAAAARIVAVARDDAGDVRAVPVVVVRRPPGS